MKKIFFDSKKGARLQVENLDDLWYLSQLVDQGDSLRGKTYRKIKLSSSNEKSKVEKKPITLTICVEKVDLTDSNLKVNGTVLTPSDDIPKGSYQSITLEINSILTLTKNNWFKFQIERLNEACSQKVKGILIAILDRELAIFALTKNYGYDVLAKLEGDVQKKEDRNVAKSSFYGDVINVIQTYLERYKLDNVIVASPAFWKEELMKKMDSELKKKVVVATVHSVDESSIKEVLKRDEIQTILKEERITKELIVVDKLLKEISKDGKAVYGIRDVFKASEVGAIETLLITDSKIKEYREKGIYEKVDNILKAVDVLKGNVSIISAKNDAGKKLNGLTGIAAILRYKLNL